MRNASLMKSCMTCLFLAPIALRVPISRVRSVVDIIMVFITPKPPASSATRPITVKSVESVPESEVAVAAEVGSGYRADSRD